jgi:hypothetical protein
MLLLRLGAQQHGAKTMNLFYYRHTLAMPPQPNEDFGRLALRSPPETVVGPEVKPFDLHFAYYTGEDEALADSEADALEDYAYRQWVLDGIEAGYRDE